MDLKNKFQKQTGIKNKYEVYTTKYIVWLESYIKLLSKYVQHDRKCKVNYFINEKEKHKCDCGLDDLLREN